LVFLICLVIQFFSSIKPAFGSKMIEDFRNTRSEMIFRKIYNFRVDLELT